MSALENFNHNQPPLDETLRLLLENAADLQAAIDNGLGGTDRLNRINLLVEAKARIPAKIESKEQSEKLTDYIAQIKKCAKAVEDERKRIKSPVTDLGRAIDARAKALQAPLDECDRLARKVLTSYLAEQDRIAQEEARAERERLAAEAARREAEAKTDEDLSAAIEAEERAQAVPLEPAKPVSARGEMGTHAGLRKSWDYSLVDLDQVPRQYLTLDEKAVKAAIKDGVRTIPGLNIFETHNITVR